MKTRLIFILIFCLAGSHAFLFAQKNDEKKRVEFEEFKAKRVAYITEEMKLTQEESQAFWPLCNELQEKKFEVNKTLRKTLRDFYKEEKEGKEHSESEYKKMVDLHVFTKEKEAELDKEYIAKFEKVISAEKIFKYQRAEQRFARKIGENRDRSKRAQEGKSPQGKQ